MLIRRIHIRTVGDEEFGDLIIVTPKSRRMQRSPSMWILRIHICASSDVLFHGFDVSFLDSSRDQFPYSFQILG